MTARSAFCPRRPADQLTYDRHGKTTHRRPDDQASRHEDAADPSVLGADGERSGGAAMSAS